MKTALQLATAPGRLQRVQQRWQEYAPFGRLLDGLRSDTVQEHFVAGLAGSSEALTLSLLRAALDRPLLVVTADSDEAGSLYEDLQALAGEDAVSLFPSRQILPYDFRAPVGEIIGQRISALSDLSDRRRMITVCPVRALIEPTIPKSVLQESQVRLEIGKEFEMDELVARLVRLGFRHVPLVEEVGDFARRGGLIDFFTPGATSPVRI